MTTSQKRNPSLEDIEEARTVLWVEQQLRRIRRYLWDHGGDDEMLRVIDYLLEENSEFWGSELVDNLRAGRLPEGEA